MQRDAKAAISRRSFLKGGGMCPSCHGVAEIKKVTARYGVTRACMIPPIWRAMRTRRTATACIICSPRKSVRHARACTGNWMQVGRRKELYGTFYQ